MRNGSRDVERNSDSGIGEDRCRRRQPLLPAESVNTQYLKPSTTTSRCPWKGLANYYSLIVDGKINEDAAWYYAKPSDAAAAIKGYIAFWKGVDVR